MKEDRRKILDMLAEGKIDADAAEHLLDKLADLRTDAARAEPMPVAPRLLCNPERRRTPVCPVTRRVRIVTVDRGSCLHRHGPSFDSEEEEDRRGEEEDRRGEEEDRRGEEEDRRGEEEDRRREERDLHREEEDLRREEEDLRREEEDLRREGETSKRTETNRVAAVDQTRIRLPSRPRRDHRR